jgi:hypothetical protein
MHTSIQAYEKSMKSLKITQFLNKEDKKQLQNYIQEIPIGKVKALAVKENSNDENNYNTEEIIKIKTIGLMISPCGILIPNVMMNDFLKDSTIKFIPLNEKFKLNVFRIKSDPKKVSENWSLVFLESLIGEFLFQVNLRDEYYYKVEDSKPLSKLIFVGYFKEDYKDSDKHVVESKIFSENNYLISVGRDILYFISKVPIHSGFFYKDNLEIYAVFNGEMMDEVSTNYKEWESKILKSEGIENIYSDNNQYYKYGANILSEKERKDIINSNVEYKRIIVQQHVQKYDQQLYSMIVNQINSKEKLNNLLIGGSRSIERICKLANAECNLLDKELVYKVLLTEKDKNNEIKKLEFQSVGIDSNSLKITYDCFYFSKTLTYLDLTCTNLSADACLDLSEFLYYNKSLTTLILCNTGLNCEKMPIICNGVKNNVSLELLNIGQNNFGIKKGNNNVDDDQDYNSAMISIVDMLTNLKSKRNTKKVFSFLSYENGFLADDSMYLFQNIKGKIEFKYLNYSDAAILVPVCEIFSSILYNNISLKELVLSNCAIEDDGFEKLLDGLSNCINLAKIDLSNNLLTFDSMKLFSNYYLKTLKNINLMYKYKKFDDDDDDYDIPVKSKFKKFKFVEEFVLNLDNNNIEFEGIIDIFKGFSSESPFLVISLANTSFKKEDVASHLWEPFDYLFTNNIPLKKLFLQRNNLTDEDIISIFQNLHNNETIQQLNLCQNNITLRGIIHITEKLRADLNFKLYVDRNPFNSNKANDSVNQSKIIPFKERDLMKKSSSRFSLQRRVSQLSNRYQNQNNFSRLLGFVYFIDNFKKKKKKKIEKEKDIDKNKNKKKEKEKIKKDL